VALRPANAEEVVVDGPAGRIEALVEEPSPSRRAVAVVCHPHPLHGGTMTNKVAHTLARAFQRAGATAVRFNFRGVGASAGTHDGGVGEREDAIAVVEWALAAHPGLPLYLGGFSFGAGIAASIANRVDAAVLVTVALPVERLGGLDHPRCPWLIVHGSDDELVSVDDVRGWREQWAPDAELSVLDGATHFFHGKLTELGQGIEAFVADIFGTPELGAPSSRETGG
jgi:alpha/beta superfamily hydrolase